MTQKEMENHPDREMTAADIVRVTLRDPRGYEATVYIPTKPDVWIAKYGKDAVEECVPDVVRYTLKGMNTLKIDTFANVLSTYHIL